MAVKHASVLVEVSMGVPRSMSMVLLVGCIVDLLHHVVTTVKGMRCHSWELLSRMEDVLRAHHLDIMSPL